MGGVLPNSTMSRKNNNRKGKRSHRNKRTQGGQGLNRNYMQLVRGYPERQPYVRNDEDSMLVFRGLLIPDHFFTHMNYVQKFNLLATSATGFNNFRGNDVFDPDQTGTGHSPMGFQQLGALWSKFRVHGSHIEVKPILVSQTSTLALCPSLLSTGPSNIQNMKETPYAIYMDFSSGILPVGYKLSKYIETRKVFGYPNIYQDDVFVGNVSTSPTSLFYWNVRGESFDGTTTMVMTVDVKITYDIEWFARINLSQS